MENETTSTVDFVKSVLIDALDGGYDDILTDLFDLYNKVRNKYNLANVGNIKIDTTKDTITGGTLYNFFSMNDNINIPCGMSDDVISFG